MADYFERNHAHAGLDVDGSKPIDTSAMLPAGLVQMWAAAAAPSGWLLCDGSAISRADYATLYAAIGDTWGAGDGSTTFNVPDFQGRAPAGVGTSSGGTDVTHVAETIALATKYNDKMQGHKHDLTLGNNNTGGVGIIGYMQFAASFGNQTKTTTTPVTDGANGTPRTGDVTRGKRLGINFIIKY